MSLSLKPEMRASIDSIKAELGKGKVVSRSRQTGKTAALLEFIHEHFSGMVDLFVCNSHTAEHIKRCYRNMYPNDEQPRIFPAEKALNERIRGITGRPWATDEVWPDAVIRKASDYEYHTYLGGVGTPMCMDLHS